MGKFNERLMGLFGIGNRGSGKVFIPSSSVPEKKEEVAEQPSVVAPVPATETTIPTADYAYSATVDGVKLSTASVAKMMEYTYGYKLRSLGGFVIENVTKHPNLNIVMYTMLHIETNKRIKIGKDVYEMLFESAGENK